jgi:hypothetical protein
MPKRPRRKTPSLESLAQTYKRLKFTFNLDLPRGRLKTLVEFRWYGMVGGGLLAKEQVPGKREKVVPQFRPKGTEGLHELKRRYPNGQLRLETLKVRVEKGRGTGALEESIAAALAEIFGVPADAGDLESAARSAAADRRELVKLLAGGPKGVRRWNDLPPLRREQRGPYLRTDLEGAKLDGVVLSSLSFNYSNFRGARLVAAHMGSASFKHADFDGADLSRAVGTGANFVSANLRGAKLTGADFLQAKFDRADLRNAKLDRVELIGASFCGADLSGATLKGAKFGKYSDGPMGTRYDSKTIFPKGFKLGVGWRRVGKAT